MALVPERRRTLAGCLLLLVLTSMVYLPALRNGYIWDDDNYVINNVTLRSVEGLGRIWLEPTSIPQYYPLVHTTFWIEYQLWGTDPLGYHAVNILLHALGAMLLWLVLRRLEVPGAFIGALLFAVHPVQVESVAWITERKNVLSICFYLGAMLLYLRFALQESLATVWPTTRRAWGLYLASLGLFVAALLSKTVTSTMPAALAVLIIWKSWPPDRGVWRRLVPLAPFFVLGLVLAWVTIELEKQHVGALGSEWEYTFVERCLIAGRVVWFYGGKLLWPEPLMFIYPRWEIDQGDVWLYLFPLAFLALLALLWAGRRRWGLGPLVAILLYVGTLTPALGFFNVYPMRYSFVADHFQYHASIWGLALLGALLAKALAARDQFRHALPVLIVVLSILTWRYTLVFESEESLWRDVLAKNDAAWIAHNNLGLILLHNGQHQEAIARFEAVLDLSSEHVNAPINLGIAYEALGDIDTARHYYRLGLERNLDNPSAINLVGNFFSRRGQHEEALLCYNQALRLRADLPILVNKANALEALARHEEAGETARRALDIATRHREDEIAQQLRQQLDRLPTPTTERN